MFVLVGGDDVRIHSPDSEKFIELAQSKDKRLKIMDKDHERGDPRRNGVDPGAIHIGVVYY